MPVILRAGPYRLGFYSRESNEPPHVHVRRERFEAKFWLEPVELAHNRGFARHEVSRIEQLVAAHRDRLLEQWHDYFGQD